MKIRLTNEDIRRTLETASPSFPKYVTQIINLANQNAQGTRPRVVGQLSDLIQEFPGQTLNEWEQWYMQKYPDAIKNAKEKIVAMVENLKDSIQKIDENMVNKWVEDLVIVQTFIGLKFQEAILKKGAEIKGVDYRLSDNTDESKGIDGYIGGIPVSVKPDTYKSKKGLSESITVKIIYYGKVKNGIDVDYNEITVTPETTL
ncbi:MAG TPA: MjaI family restriction endonuclease [Nitrospirota bacterium]|nr:MjaI family restriction endonuclease [Nitrospirota bacterium]